MEVFDKAVIGPVHNSRLSFEMLGTPSSSNTSLGVFRGALSVTRAPPGSILLIAASISVHLYGLMMLKRKVATRKSYYLFFEMFHLLTDCFWELPCVVVDDRYTDTVP